MSTTELSDSFELRAAALQRADGTKRVARRRETPRANKTTRKRADHLKGNKQLRLKYTDSLFGKARERKTKLGPSKSSDRKRKWDVVLARCDIVSGS